MILLSSAVLLAALAHEAPFSQWEEQCRVGRSDMTAECQAAVLTGYSTLIGSPQVTCDFSAFWKFTDRERAKIADQQWSLAVIFVSMQRDVCWTTSPTRAEPDTGL